MYPPISLPADISIHALCEEGDRSCYHMTVTEAIFLSTPSARRATVFTINADRYHDISIHALCEEGDLPPTICPIVLFAFLSTPSARRATFGDRRSTN